MKISYESDSGSGYNHQQIMFKTKIASINVPNSLDKASSHHDISGSKPS
jgi:hypothetical protein